MTPPLTLKGSRKSEDTAGASWGHMRAPQLTTELKRDLLLVKMRGALDPKRFYRSSDSGKGLPKYFQVGTIVAGAEDGSFSQRCFKSLPIQTVECPEGGAMRQ